MKRRFSIIIFLMTTSLLGIIIIQVLWVRHAVKVEGARFDQLVFKALNDGILQLQQKGIFYFMDQKLDLPPPPPDLTDSFENVYFNSPVILDSLSNILDSSLNIQNNKMIKLSNKLKKVHSPDKHAVIIKYDSATGTTTVKSINKGASHNIDVEIVTNEDIKNNQSLRQRQNDSVANKKEEKLREAVRGKDSVIKENIEKFRQNIKQWAFEYSFDVNRLNDENIIGTVDSTIARALANNGISLVFNSQIIQQEKDTIIIIKSSTGQTGLLSGQYKTELFPDDLFRKNIYLLIEFPGRKSQIYKSVYLLAIGSFIFTMVILATFGITLYTIQKQKKLSDIKNDFINNMTHEFKIPIATISLAADTLNSPKIMGKEEQTRYYLNIIRQENKRMNNQVEQVLQMSLIDNQDFKLNLRKCNVHTIIEDTIQAAELVVKEKEGKILSSLRANCSDIPVDEIHFINVLNNLLDNALKYCEKAPDILIETFNKDNKLVIRVSDNGIGMSKEVQKHIFDKFYRKSTGNIHNVKGFGLGLSYVKTIVEAHGGEISVSSNPGSGSIFTLELNC